MVVMSGRPKRCALVLLLGLGLAACSSAAQSAQNYYESGQKLVAAHDDTGQRSNSRTPSSLKRTCCRRGWRWRISTSVITIGPELVTVLRSNVDLDPKDVDTKLKLARLMLFGGAADKALRSSLIIHSTQHDYQQRSMCWRSKAGIFYKLKDT